MTRLAKPLFFLAVALTFVMATLPHPPHVPLNPPDKVQHMLAFATLAVLGTLAFRAASLIRLVAALILFGALIEIVQAIPALHRDSDILDLAADTVAALVAAGATRILLWYRER